MPILGTEMYGWVIIKLIMISTIHLVTVLSLVMLEKPCWCILTETLSCDEEIAALRINPQLAVQKEIIFF